MEALVGAAAAALTVYDMTKGLDHGIRIERGRAAGEARGQVRDLDRAPGSERDSDA